MSGILIRVRGPVEDRDALHTMVSVLGYGLWWVAAGSWWRIGMGIWCRASRPPGMVAGSPRVRYGVAMKPFEIRDRILRAALPGAKLVDGELLSPGRRLHLSDSPVCGAVAWVTLGKVKTHRVQVCTNDSAYVHTWMPAVEWPEGFVPYVATELDRSVAMYVGTDETVSDACAAVAALWDNGHEWVQSEREARQLVADVIEFRAHNPG